MICLSEDEETDLIPVKWIEEYHYCPRIIFFMGVLGFRERETALMSEGREAEEAEEEREKRRSTLLAKRRERVLDRWQNLAVRSNTLGLVGVVDLIIKTESGLKIVEIKNTDAKRLLPGYLYQTVAYAMLAEEAFRQPVRSVIIHHLKGGRTFEVNVTDEMRGHVKWTVDRIRSILTSEKLPATKRVKECKGCGYNRICKSV